MTQASDQISDIIANSIDRAGAASDEAIQYTDTAQTIAQGYQNFGPNNTVVAQAIDTPPFVPNVDLSANYKTDFDTIWQDMEVWVRGLMSDYMNTYFPILDPAVQDAENAWLINVITNGYVGIPTNIETAIWERARDRDAAEAMRMEDEIATQISSRGFSMPPGVMYNKLQQAQQEAANKSSNIGRDVAIKQIEISVEMTKVAIEHMTKLRIGIAAALADFMKAWLSLPGAAADVAKVKSDFNRTVWDSSSNYINALVSKAALQLDVDKTNLNAKLQSDNIQLQNFMGAQKLRTEAAVSAAAQMGQIAAAYAQNINTLSHIGDVTTTSA